MEKRWESRKKKKAALRKKNPKTIQLTTWKDVKHPARENPLKGVTGRGRWKHRQNEMNRGKNQKKERGG